MILSWWLRETATEHVEALGRRRWVTVQWVQGSQHSAATDTRVVRGPPIVSALDYLCVLHELGHIVAPRARRANDEDGDYDYRGADEIAIEGAAWAWAVDKALPEIAAKLSEKDLAAVGSMFTTYVRHWAHKE